MIKAEGCPGCGRLTYTEDLGGVRVKTDTEPLDGAGALTALLGGTGLYRITYLGGRPAHHRSASPAVLEALRTAEPAERPMVVREHHCRNASVAVSRPSTPTPGPSVQPTPPGPPVGRTAPFSGPQAGPSSVPAAEQPRSEPPAPAPDGPRCSACSQPCSDGTYAAIEVGELTVWAMHVGRCGEATGI